MMNVHLFISVIVIETCVVLSFANLPDRTETEINEGVLENEAVLVELKETFNKQHPKETDTNENDRLINGWRNLAELVLSKLPDGNATSYVPVYVTSVTKKLENEGEINIDKANFSDKRIDVDLSNEHNSRNADVRLINEGNAPTINRSNEETYNEDYGSNNKIKKRLALPADGNIEDVTMPYRGFNNRENKYVVNDEEYQKPRPRKRRPPQSYEFEESKMNITFERDDDSVPKRNNGKVQTEYFLILKSLLKIESNKDLSLSEILRHQNLTLTDILQGKADIIDALKVNKVQNKDIIDEEMLSNEMIKMLKPKKMSNNKKPSSYLKQKNQPQSGDPYNDNANIQKLYDKTSNKDSSSESDELQNPISMKTNSKLFIDVTTTEKPPFVIKMHSASTDIKEPIRYNVTLTNLMSNQSDASEISESSESSEESKGNEDTNRESTSGNNPESKFQTIWLEHIPTIYPQSTAAIEDDNDRRFRDTEILKSIEMEYQNDAPAVEDHTVNLELNLGDNDTPLLNKSSSLINNSTLSTRNSSYEKILLETEPEVKEEIFELYSTSGAASKLKQLLESRNMSIGELIALRQRGSSKLHLSAVSQYKEKTLNHTGENMENANSNDNTNDNDYNSSLHIKLISQKPENITDLLSAFHALPVFDDSEKDLSQKLFYNNFTGDVHVLAGSFDQNTLFNENLNNVENLTWSEEAKPTHTDDGTNRKKIIILKMKPNMIISGVILAIAILVFISIFITYKMKQRKIYTYKNTFSKIVFQASANKDLSDSNLSTISVK